MNNPVSLKKTNIRISFDGTTEPIWSNFYSYEVPSSLIQNAIHLQELHLLSKPPLMQRRKSRAGAARTTTTPRCCCRCGARKWSSPNSSRRSAPTAAGPSTITTFEKSEPSSAARSHRPRPSPAPTTSPKSGRSSPKSAGSNKQQQPRSPPTRSTTRG